MTRSFPAFEPFCIRQSFPLWAHDTSLDPRLLEGMSEKDQAKVLAESGVVIDLPELKKPEDLMAEDSLPNLLRELGGTCLKTKFRDAVIKTFHLSRRKVMLALNTAIAKGSILATEKSNAHHQSAIHLTLRQA